jgi:hypothetical protein
MLKPSVFASVVATVVVDQPSNTKIHTTILGHGQFDALFMYTKTVQLVLQSDNTGLGILISIQRSASRRSLPFTLRTQGVEKARQLENLLEENTKQRHNN